MKPLRILLAEDHAVVREGTREMLEREEGLVVVGEAADGLEAVSMAELHSPDVVLLDLGLPILNGIESTRRIRAQPDPPKVLILSAYDDVDYVKAAIEAGANGYILKTAHAREVAAAVRAVGLGEMVLDPGVLPRLLAASGGRGDRERLSERESQVLRLAARGAHNKEIAALMRVSVRTVEAHFTRIFNKLDASSRTEAIVKASTRGWLTLDVEERLS